MPPTSDAQSEQGWPGELQIDKDEFIRLIFSVKPNLTKKKIRAEIRHCQTYDNAKHRLPPGDSFDNNIAAEWILAKHPELACLSGFPNPKTGYLDSKYFTIVVPPPDELPLAYRQCRHENMELLERNSVLEEENRYLKEKLARWG